MELKSIQQKVEKTAVVVGESRQLSGKSERRREFAVHPAVHTG